MPERTVTFFDEPGEKNTSAVINVSKRRAAELGIDEFVVASTTGKTALQAATAFAAEGLTKAKVIGVTLQAGTWAKYAAPDPAIVADAERRGVVFLTATHTLMGNVASCIREKFGGIAPTELIAHVLYLFGQGMKVAVEVAVMAADAGLLTMDNDIIAIAGTNEGADTAVVIKPAYSTDFFDLRVREVVAMPRR